VAPTHIASAAAVLKSLKGQRFDLYLPFDPFHEPFSPSALNNPQSFLILASIANDPTRRFIVTDAGIFYLIGSKIVPVEDTDRR
jgi:hypothetical protein